MYNHFMAGCRIPHFETLFMFGIHTRISQFSLRLSFPSIFPVPVNVPVVIALQNAVPDTASKTSLKADSVVIALQNTVPDTPKTLCLTA